MTSVGSSSSNPRRVPLRLLCCDEPANSQPRRALPDPAMFADDRVLCSLLKSEDAERREDCYLRYTSGDLLPYMRRMVVEWMLEVMGEMQCDETVFPLSVVYLDQAVLVLPSVGKDQLQLLGVVSMFIASKFRDTKPLCAQTLVYYTDFSVTVDDITQWEIVVLDALKWKISWVTPPDFVDQLLMRLPLDVSRRLAIRRHAHAFIALCSVDANFAACPASMVACGCILTATNGLLGKTICNQFLKRLHRLIAANKECLRQCHEQIEHVFQTTFKISNSATPSTAVVTDGTSRGEDLDGARNKPDTPTDVRDVRLDAPVADKVDKSIEATVTTRPSAVWLRE